MNKPPENENQPIACSQIDDHAARLDADKASTITVEKPAAKDLEHQPLEVNGPKGLEPTRYGDWEANGRCYDF